VKYSVKIYSVDSPNTKPIPFWQCLIAEVHKVDRDVIFLAEAFTRRAMMRQLAKIGFTQGYTYFTWKNSRHVLAATLSPTYGIYSGYEHYENVPVREGSEEYLNSEKYELWQRSLDGPML